MAVDPSDPTGIGSGQMDPLVQSLIDKYRQQQMLEAATAQQTGVGNPKNEGEGIAALGAGFANMLKGFAGLHQNQMNQAIAGQLGSVPVTPLPALPAITPQTMVQPGSATTGSLSTPVSPAASATPPASDIVGSASGLNPVQQATVDTWRKAGANNIAIAGVLGNMGQESQFKPGVTGDPDRGGSVGLFQHLGDRKTALLRAVPDLNPVGQNTFAIGELGGPNAPNLSIEKLNSARSPAEAAQMFMSGFERPNARYANLSNRQAIANQLAGQLGGASIAPETHAVPAGLVAGPGAASTLPSPVPRPPAMAGLSQTAVSPPIQTASVPPPAPPSPVAIAPEPIGPTPSSVNPALSNIPMGPPQGFTPPVGGGPGAAVSAPSAAPPVTPQVTPSPVGLPPVAARPAPAVAPAAGGSAYDPRTGRFLAPGEQIPGYAPAPMSSTGGQGIGGLLASLFGGGTAQAAPAPALARGLTGTPQGRLAPAGQGLPAPTPVANGVAAVASLPAATSPAGAAPPPAAAASGNTNPLLPALAQRYSTSNTQYQQAQSMANRAAGTPFAAAFQKQADAARSDAESAYKSYMDIQGQELTHARDTAEKVVRPMTDEEAKLHGVDKADYMVNPTTNMPVQIGGLDKKDTWAQPTPEQAASLPNGGKGLLISNHGDIKAIPAEKTSKEQIVEMTDSMGNKVPGTVENGVWKPLAVGQPGAPATSGGAPATGGAIQNAPAATHGGAVEDTEKLNLNEAALPGTTQPASPGLTKEEQGRLDALNAPDGYKAQIKSIIAGEETPPKNTTTPRAQALMNNVMAVRPGFSLAQAQMQVAARKAYGPGGPMNSPGQLILNANALIDHAATFQDKTEDYGKGFGQAASQKLYDWTGTDPLGILAKKNALEAAATVTGTEAVKYLTASPSGGGEGERERWAAAMSDPSHPPEARLATAKVLVQDSLEKLMEVQSRWKSSFQGQKIGDYPTLSPQAIANAKKLGFSDWFDKNDNLVGEGKGIPKPDAGAGTYAPGMGVVPGSTVGTTPGNTPGMLKGEENQLGLAPLAGGMALAGGLGAGMMAAPALAPAAMGAALGHMGPVGRVIKKYGPEGAVITGADYLADYLRHGGK